jgi:two-component system sensor histidine kinase KdpD
MEKTGAPPRAGEMESPTVTSNWAGYAWTVVELGVCTAIAWAMYPYCKPELSNLIMVYLLGVAVIAARFGRGPAIASSILSVAAFDFLFVEPRFTFAVEETRYLFTFAVMLTVALLISSLTALIRQQVTATMLRERRTAALAIEAGRLAAEARDAQIQVESEKSRSALLSSVSHDLRTPLASICGAASSLLTDPSGLPPAAQRELVQTISEEADRLSRLVGNLLEMTKLDSGAKARKEWCPLEEVVGSALNRLDKILQSRPVNIQLPPDLPAIPMDVVMIEQVLINLFENAAKYTPSESALDVSAAATNESVTIRIADRGPGLAPGDEKKIFEKFYRGKSSGGASGAGLGLPICRAIVEAHGGKIWAENRPSISGGGAVFSFTLPLIAERQPVAPGINNEIKHG